MAPDPVEWRREAAWVAANRRPGLASWQVQAERVEAGADPATTAAFDHLCAERIKEELSDNPFLAARVDWQALFDDDAAEAEWLLEPFIARGRAHAIYASAKEGKSFLVLAACAALASGRPFLAKGASQPVSVLYGDWEMTREDLRDNLAGFGYQPGDLAHLHYSLLPVASPLDTAEGGYQLVQAAMDVGAQLVVIDTTSRAVSGEENDADTIRAFYRHTGLALKAAGIAWVRIDHAGKDAGQGQRGSSAKNDDVDVVWRLTRREKPASLLEATHRRMSWVPEKVALTVSEDDKGLWTIAAPELDLTWPAGTAECARTLERLGVPAGTSANRAQRVLQAAGEGTRRQIVLAAMRWRQREQELHDRELFGFDG